MKNKGIEERITNILKIGITLSSIFILIGILLSSFTTQNLNINKYTFLKMIEGLFKLDYYSYLMFGIFILILTPILRIVGLFTYYKKEKDHNFMIISITVLIILCMSLVLGVTHN